MSEDPEIDNSLLNDSCDSDFCGDISFMGAEISHCDDDGPGSIRIVPRDKLMEEMRQEIKEAAELTCLPSSTVRIMLNCFQWDKAKLLEKTVYGESFLHLRDVGIIVNPVKPVCPKVPLSTKADKQGASGICMVCNRKTHIMSLNVTACDHLVCERCLQRHLISELQIGDRSHFKCPFILCSMMLDDDLVRQHLSPPLKLIFKKLCLKDFVNNNKYRRFCPTEGCHRSAHYDVDLSTKFREVHCECGARYCFGCGNLWHYPLSCDLLKRWLNVFDKVPGYTSFVNFKFNSQEKPCPCCFAFTENRWERPNIICSACNFKFCWKCLGKSSSKHTCSFNMDIDPDVHSEMEALVQLQTDYAQLSRRDVSSFNGSVGLSEPPELYECGIITPWKKMNSSEIFDIIEKSQHLLRHSFVFAYFLENTLSKLQFLNLLFAFEKLVGAVTEDFNQKRIGEDMEIMFEQLHMERSKLLHSLGEGFDRKLWDIRSMKWKYAEDDE